MAGGHLTLLLQPAELIIIGGAAMGAFVASSTGYSLKQVLKNAPKVLGGSSASKDTYMQTLALLYGLFNKTKREGLISIEKDVEEPSNSPMFQAFPSVLKDKQVCDFIGDTMRTFLTTGNASELAELMDTDIESIHEELHASPSNIGRMADSLPGMGIVAAVLGVVVAMGMINEAPEVLGHHVGAALLGTFLGILLCYGIFGPIGAKLDNMMQERVLYFKCIREALLAAVHGLSPMAALEHGRRAIPPTLRPTFLEMEQTLKSQGGAAAPK